MGRPKLLLLDEPSLGLSPILVTQIFGIIKRINQEQGVSILLVEQNAHIALKTADYGYILEVGRIVLQDECASAARARGHQRILSRPEGRRHPRRAAVEEEEAVALIETQKPVVDIAANIPAMVFAQVEAHGRETILRKKDRGIWRAMSWADLGKAARQVAMALKASGFRRGEVACVLADTSPAWVMTDLGILCAGGISAGLYTTEAVEQLQVLLERLSRENHLRRQRRAARQDPADQRRLPGARTHRDLRLQGPARFQRSDVREFSGLHGTRRDL